MWWDYLAALAGLLGIGVVLRFLAVCSSALDAEHARVSGRVTPRG